MSTATEHVNGTEQVSGAEAWARAGVADAEAEAIRARTAVEVEERRIAAEAAAEATRIRAREEAEKQRLANERTRMRVEKEKATHRRQVAEEEAKEAAARTAKEKTERAAEDEAATEAERAADQQRTENWWKWGARGIYAVGLIIAAPVQFLHFWDPKRPFLIAAPGLLEGFALVLACGAAWAVAHKRDVAPYRVGIMLGAIIAAAINLYGGVTDKAIGFNAGLIGAIASLGGPIVLMSYEHGIAQKADGIASRRERRAAKKAKKKADEEKAAANAEKEAAAAAVAAEKAAKEAAARAEQERKDKDRKAEHEDVWNLAEKLRAARGEEFVTDTIWGDAWYLAKGSKKVGIDAEIEAAARAAQARMKAVTDMPILGDLSQVESQKATRAKKDPDAPDGRRHNGGTPPRRTPGDTEPYSAAARKQAALEQTSKTASGVSDE